MQNHPRVVTKAINYDIPPPITAKFFYLESMPTILTNNRAFSYE